LLGRIFGPEREEVVAALFANVISVRTRWVHAALTGKKRKPEGSRPLGTPRHRWKDNIKKDHR